MRTTLRLRIAGRVQGVGFRYSLQREAAARALTGWVRNRRDGSVEALLQGESAAVRAVADWARRGPPGARVDRVEENSPVAEPDQDCTGFETLPTA